MDAYLEKIADYKTKNPDNIIFRNKNLNKDFKIEIAKQDDSFAQSVFEENPNDHGKTFYTMSPYTPSKARDPPSNFSNVQVSLFYITPIEL